MLGEGASVTEVGRLRHELGLDRPILDQYKTYLADLLHGNLGVSFRDQQPVAKSIRTRYPATIELTVAALILSILFAIPAGVISAIRRGRLADKAPGLFSLFGVSLPNFALGPLLILLFSIALGLFPCPAAMVFLISYFRQPRSAQVSPP